MELTTEKQSILFAYLMMLREAGHSYCSWKVTKNNLILINGDESKETVPLKNIFKNYPAYVG